MHSIAVSRTRHRILPNARRVLARPYALGEEVLAPGPSRTGQLVARILAIPETEVGGLLAGIVASFDSRHRRYREILEQHFRLVAHHIEAVELLSLERRLLIGAYFTHEYAVEAAALFNPSIVLAPDQTGLGAGESRFIMTLRAVGEGHLSSIEFRTGLIDGAGELTFDAPGDFLVSGHRTAPRSYNKKSFSAKLGELGVANEIAGGVLDRLSNNFSLADLEGSLAELEKNGPSHAIWFETVKIIRVLASSNYVTTFPADSALSERVIFPAGPNETRGMEDARFVRFTEDGGAFKYYATYTAYDGFEIVPQLIETDDFVTFTIATLNGRAAQNKGMALFPRLINGKYVMLSRRDRENLHLAVSDDVRFWNDVTELYRPSRPWELLHSGNCGSPLETDAGWLVLTHGVGPMRCYAISALLLDLEDPSKVIGHLAEPLLVPDETEREGYTPNVLYTCGGLIDKDKLVLPYGYADSGIGVAVVSLPQLLAELKAEGGVS
ncbi:MAG TPA: glycoside hydrolase family 130 protein [Polyangiaceae bacterium]|nr:glycoside hydrolase family 130 protein [Polyangiaceae bacterium]